MNFPLGLKIHMIAVLIFSSFFSSSAFGYTIEYQVLGKTIQSIPTICTIPPNEPELDDGAKKMLVKEAAASVQEWQALLQTAFPYSRQNWQINYKLVSDNDLPTVNEQCDVVIHFVSKPVDPALYYRTLGITEIEIAPITVTVFYQNIGICKEYKGNIIYQSYCYVDGTLLPRSIGNTIRHELGHAFGLGHYLASDPAVSIGWSTGDQEPPSVMVIAEHNNPYKIMIKPVDIEQLRKIYGEEGFAGNPQDKESATKTIPVWVKNNAKWWSHGLIDESEFVRALQYLINEKIINIADLPKPTEVSSHHIPDWIKNNAKWWSEGSVSEGEFVNAIKYLVQNGIIKLD